MLLPYYSVLNAIEDFFFLNGKIFLCKTKFIHLNNEKSVPEDHCSKQFECGGQTFLN